jgi:hypothetical protein
VQVFDVGPEQSEGIRQTNPTLDEIRKVAFSTTTP